MLYIEAIGIIRNSCTCYIPTFNNVDTQCYASINATPHNPNCRSYVPINIAYFLPTIGLGVSFDKLYYVVCI